jgi:hypothetical protein
MERLIIEQKTSIFIQNLVCSYKRKDEKNVSEVDFDNFILTKNLDDQFEN